LLQLTSATDPLASGANKYQGPARSGDRKVAFAVEVAHQSKGAGVGNTRRYSNPTGQRADMHSATGVLNIISSHATAHLRWSLSCPDTQGIRETINLEVTNMSKFETITLPTKLFKVFAIVHQDKDGSTCETFGFTAEVLGIEAGLSLGRMVLEGNIPVEGRLVQVEVSQVVRKVFLSDDGTWGETDGLESMAKGQDLGEFIESAPGQRINRLRPSQRTVFNIGAAA
jgi:hypothetical protein